MPVDKEKKRLHDAERYQRNREQILQQKAGYRANNREKIQAKDTLYREGNQESIRQWQQDYYQTHRELRLESRKKSTEKNYDAVLDRSALYHQKQRQSFREKLINALGRKCCHCGYDADIRALQIDHVNGGGTQERKSFQSLRAYYNHILRNVDSGNYQILCANCNAIKRAEEKEHGSGPKIRKTRIV